MADKGWNARDEKCPHCNSIIKQAKGINKQNIKRLCWSRPTMQDWLIFIMLLLSLFLAWAYYTETAQYKFMYENPEEFCASYWNIMPEQTMGTSVIDLDDLTYSQ